MKKLIPSLLLGSISSLLLSIGFITAAEKFSPMSVHHAVTTVEGVKTSPGCTGPCGLI